MSGRRTIGRPPSTALVCATLGCVALIFFAEPRWAKAEDDTVTIAASSDGRGPITRATGTIVDYTGRELRLRMSGGHQRSIPASRVLAIESPRTAEEQAADKALGRGDLAKALDRYRAAMQADKREWARRRIMAQIVRCLADSQAWEQACDEFLRLVAADRATQYFDAIPLAWAPAEPSPGLEQKARQWIDETDQPVAALLGASHLLATNQRPAATEALQRLSKDHDSRVALLAQAQLWRTTAFRAEPSQVEAWLRTLEKMPELLRAGPALVVGKALERSEPEQAVLMLLRVPLLHPQNRSLAAAALASAAGALEKLKRPEEAYTLWAALAATYPERPEGAEARRWLKEHNPDLDPRTLVPLQPADSRLLVEERFVTALRAQGLYDLAEKYCRYRLADTELDDIVRADLTIELVRSLAEHALATAPDERGPLWQSAAEVIEEFTRKRSQNPRLLLVRMQAGLVALGRAELERQEAEIGSAASANLNNTRSAVRAAVAQFKELDSDITRELQLRGRPTSGVAGQLGDAELTSLQANVRYQLVRAFRNQALSYPADSDDRLNALTQAIELLGPLSQADENDPLTWPSRVEQIICLRQMGRLADATHRLVELEKAKPPEAALRRLRAEGARLLLAKGRIDEALNVLGKPQVDDSPGAAEVDFARFEALIAAWQRASASKDDKGDEKKTVPPATWEKRANDQIQHIETVHGPYWMRRAETLLAGTLAKSQRSKNLASLTRVAMSYYRGGQIDQALAAYDEAIQEAESKEDQEATYEIASAAAAIEHQRKHYHDAAIRFQRLALALPEHPRAAEAHLAAIYDEAEAAKVDPAHLADYHRMLEEHLEHWPTATSAGQVAVWLGKLCEHESHWQEAIRAYRTVAADQSQFAAAVEGAARCYPRLLAEKRAAAASDENLAREAANWFEQIATGGAAKPAKLSALQRAAALAAARIWVADVPGGGVHAEDVLTTALTAAPDAPPEWQSSARALLVTARAAQGRVDEAVSTLDQLSGGNAEDLIVMLESLMQSSDYASPELRRRLADLELKTIQTLSASPQKLATSQKQRLDRVRARALADSGDRAAALALSEKLARAHPDEGQLQAEWAELLSQSTEPAQIKQALAKWREISDRTRPDTPRWLRAYLGMAEAQLALGHRAQARTLVKLVQLRNADLGGEAYRERFQRILATTAK